MIGLRRRLSNSFGDRAKPYDVAIVVEGCYPYVVGGVSSWLDWLFKACAPLRFCVTPIVADDAPREIKYDIPPNVTLLAPIALTPRPDGAASRRNPTCSSAVVAENLSRLIRDGDADALAAFSNLVREADLTREQLLDSRFGWEIIERLYQVLTPHASFNDAFWSLRTLVSGLFAIAAAPVPRAQVFHAISTGYAGLYAARAALETTAVAALTEHGIYTNERRMDLMAADGLHDAISFGLSLDDERRDVRGLWCDAFDSMARIAYTTSSRVTTLYADNQPPQRAGGAGEESLQVIANGIDFDRFASLPGAEGPRPPTVALIGRVTPVKDIKTYIAAIDRCRRIIPDLCALMIGPDDEDPSYAAECREMVKKLALEDTFTFTGRADIRAYLPKVDVLALTSVSEAQPLVLLEAGAAGIPCVATDVGSCREIIEGRSDEDPALGPGGLVVDLVDVDGLAAAMAELLAHPGKRNAFGAALRTRVETYFQSKQSAEQYLRLYRELMAEHREGRHASRKKRRTDAA